MKIKMHKTIMIVVLLSLLACGPGMATVDDFGGETWGDEWPDVGDACRGIGCPCEIGECSQGLACMGGWCSPCPDAQLNCKCDLDLACVDGLVCVQGQAGNICAPKAAADPCQTLLPVMATGQSVAGGCVAPCAPGDGCEHLECVAGFAPGVSFCGWPNSQALP